jgi:hypothetical protein
LLVQVAAVAASLQDGALAKHDHLLRRGCPEPRAPACRGKNGRHDHGPDYMR